MAKPEPPEFEIKITAQPVTYQHRKLRTSWSTASAQSLRDLWGFSGAQKSPLQDLADGLGADNFEEWFKEWKDSRRPGVELASSMAQEIANEIDQEILAALSPNDPRTADKIGHEIRKSLDLAQQGRLSPDLHKNVMEIWRSDRDKKKERALRNGFIYTGSKVLHCARRG